MYPRKNGQTAELAQDDWLEILLAEEMNVTVVVNHFFLLQLHWDMCLNKNTKHFYCYFLFLLILKSTNIY